MKDVQGFTLIEMAIVLLIITLMVSSAIGPLGAQIELRRRAETQKALDEIKEALIGYAIVNGALPCPSALASGIPTGFARTSCNSTNSSGYLPWVTLGVTRQDAGGNLFGYAVSPGFANSTLPFKLSDSGTFTIQTRDNNGNVAALSNNIPAVVISFGKNAYGARSADGILQTTPATFGTNNSDECQNVKGSTDPTMTCSGGNTPYFSRTPTPPGTASSLGGEFDDLVVWISPNILFNRMVAAGKLP